MRALLALTLFCTACTASPSPPRIETAQPQTADVAVYFTNPASDNAGTLRGGPDALLAEAIRAARVSVDMAIYDLNLWSIRDALLDAHDNGVNVRLVVESDSMEESRELQELEAAGIPMVFDFDQDLMHNKFAIIDQYQVWTGSMNYTLSDTYFSRNNLIAISSAELAENYLAEFEEMFVDYAFGEGSPRNTPHPTLDLESAQVETYFAPEDSTLARLLELVNAAELEVRVLAFSLTADALADALIAAAERGVVVTIVMDEDQALNNAGGEYFRLLDAGLDVRLDGEEGNLHDKVIIIDSAIVVTGSYNFSRNAEENNDENTQILHSPAMAAKYLEEFARIWELALR
jgi:phosphatidylserine/phosphatidylglycerophosphate/cardiolipin synthase-like enzyme